MIKQMPEKWQIGCTTQVVAEPLTTAAVHTEDIMVHLSIHCLGSTQILVPLSGRAYYGRFCHGSLSEITLELPHEHRAL